MGRHAKFGALGKQTENACDATLRRTWILGRIHLQPNHIVKLGKTQSCAGIWRIRWFDFRVSIVVGVCLDRLENIVRPDSKTGEFYYDGRYVSEGMIIIKEPRAVVTLFVAIYAHDAHLRV